MAREPSTFLNADNKEVLTRRGGWKSSEDEDVITLMVLRRVNHEDVSLGGKSDKNPNGETKSMKEPKADLEK